MKLILANNQTERFVDFYENLKGQSSEPFDYTSYDSLLFTFDTDATPAISVKSMSTGRDLHDYDGVYLNGYLDTYEIATTMATCCEALGVAFVNQELAGAPSLSKLSAYAKLSAGGVRVPRTLAGAQAALLRAADDIARLNFPLVLKRADADRGLNNYMVSSAAEIFEILTPHEPRSIWLLQEFVPNDGFYLVSFYDQKPSFCIFRSLQERPDHNPRKAHMFKPKGGANATIVELGDIPKPVIDIAQKAIDVMNRQIGSVDCLYDPKTGQVNVLEVNFNPQLVTVNTFKEIHIDTFLEGISKIQ